MGSKDWEHSGADYLNHNIQNSFLYNILCSGNTLHALSVRVGRAIKHLVGDGGLSMRVVPRIRINDYPSRNTEIVFRDFFCL